MLFVNNGRQKKSTFLLCMIYAKLPFQQAATPLIQRYILICSIRFLDMFCALLLFFQPGNLLRVLCIHKCFSRYDKQTSGSNVLLLLKHVFYLCVLPIYDILPCKMYLLSVLLPRIFHIAQLLPVCFPVWFFHFFFARTFVVSRAHARPGCQVLFAWEYTHVQTYFGNKVFDAL